MGTIDPKYKIPIPKGNAAYPIETDGSVGFQGIPGPSSMIHLEIPDGVWTEKHAVFQGLCIQVLNFMNKNPEIADSVGIQNEGIWSFKRPLKKKMSWKGCRGPRAFSGMRYIEDIIKEIQENLGISRENILFGTRCEIPINAPCDIYVRFKDDSVEYFYKGANGWVNWNYEET